MDLNLTNLENLENIPIISRKFNSELRKKILEKINKIKDKKILVSILNIIKKEDTNGYSQNKSGIYFNLNKLADDSIELISNIIEPYIDMLNSETEEESNSDKIVYKQYSNMDNLDNYDNLGPRLSNQEKSILKKFNKNT